MSEEYGVPDAEEKRENAGIKKQAHQFIIGAEMGKNEEGDAHRRMNQALSAAERY